MSKTISALIDAFRSRKISFGLSIGFAIAIASPVPVAAQTAFPSKPLRLIVAFGPGGVADTVGRLVGQQLNERFGQPVVVDNRAGAGGIVAAKLVAAAPSDGYTLLVITGAVVINAVTSKEGVDPRNQVTTVAVAASAPTIFAANRAITANNLMDYLRSMKDGHFTYSTAGIGTAEHLTSEYIFKAIPGLAATHVPYPGGGAAVTAVLGQQVDLVTTPVPSAMSFIKDGRLRALAVASHKRISSLPEVPTLAEAGFADFENMTWIAFFAPAKVPASVVSLLNTEINNVLRKPNVRERLALLGFDTRSGSHAEAAAYVKNEVAKWERIVKTTGFVHN